MPGPLTPNAKAPWAFSYVLLVALFLGETFEILSQAFSTDANAQSFLTIFSEYKHKCPDSKILLCHMTLHKCPDSKTLLCHMTPVLPQKPQCVSFNMPL